jgi:hypothetical protein
MARKKVARRRSTRGYQPFDLVRDHYEVSGSSDGRRYLKHLDRRLQRFSSQIDSLEAQASRLEDESDADLILAVESLQRETLLLRAEIREHLAGGSRSLADMTEYADECWEQLRDTFEELKENLEPEDEVSKLAGPIESPDDEDQDEDWTDPDDESSVPEVHPPRVGPKR